VFDVDKCQTGLESLRQYRASYDESKGVFNSTPVHDKHSHPADAWRTMAMGIKEYSSEYEVKRRSAGVIGSYDPYANNHTQLINNWDVFNRGV
jgi:hypothetical protein